MSELIEDGIKEGFTPMDIAGNCWIATLQAFNKETRQERMIRLLKSTLTSKKLRIALGSKE